MVKKSKVTSGASGTVSKHGPMLQLPAGFDDDITPQKLLLDPGNLRLLDTDQAEIANTRARLIGQKAVQDRVTSIIASEPSFKISGLMTSIKANGFLKHERIIVAPFDSQSFLVLEGNRRVTAVRQIFEKHGPTLSNLPAAVRDSLTTLPCFRIDGPTINGNDEQLDWYRRAAASYIGTRHLMEFVSWEPASRYEFQGRLVKSEGWTLEQVVERFGRKRSDVIRDLKAQSLYHTFRDFETREGVKHRLVYNAFAEAARAAILMTWLGWNEKKYDIQNDENAEAFFCYLINRVRNLTDDEEESDLRGTAKDAVKWFKEMLSLGDEEIEAALLNKEFAAAEALYEERKEGSIEKRLTQYTKALRRLTLVELQKNPDSTKECLELLRDAVTSTLVAVDAIISSRRSSNSSRRRAKH